MALIKCPECDLQVSDKALSCPHCGYPINQNHSSIKVSRKSKNKHRRLPNGFGRIAEIKDKNLRNPFRAMITVGKNQFNKPIGKIIGFFPTYNDAYQALVDYHRSPYDLDLSITIKQLYDKWTDKYFEDLKSDTAKRTIESAWLYCSSLYDMRAKDVRARHIKGCMEDGYRIEYRGKNKGKKVFATASTKSRIKSMFNLMLDFALEYEIVDRNYARTFEISGDIIKELESSKRSHIIFSDSEINTLWDNIDTISFVDMIVIQIYSGWRPQELSIIELDNVDINNWVFTGGMKTDAGINRCVPIHTAIRPYVKRWYDKSLSVGSKTLFSAKGQTHAGRWEMTYDKYATRFEKVIMELNINPEHRPHDPRNTFITLAKKSGIDDNAIKKIVGHSSKDDVTEYVYTDRDIEWLRSDIEKIKVGHTET